MKKNNILLIIAGLLLTLSGVNAEYIIYDKVEDFEAAKGAVCEAATDGCNNYFIGNGKVMGGTLMACGPDFKPEWTCTKFKDNVMTTKSIPTTTSIDFDEIVACTMEYMPVCGVDKKTYGNKCMAEAGAKVDIAYEGECRISGKLSQNDENFYNSIKKKLDIKYQNKVDNTIVKYFKKIDKYSNSKQEKINNKLISELDQKISYFLLKYPQDIALPKKANDIYFILELFRFELIKLEF